MKEQFITPRYRERIDQVAQRAFRGDPLRYVELAELNPDVDLFYPHPELPLRISGENPASL